MIKLIWLQQTFSIIIRFDWVSIFVISCANWLSETPTLYLMRLILIWCAHFLFDAPTLYLMWQNQFICCAYSLFDAPTFWCAHSLFEAPTPYSMRLPLLEETQLTQFVCPQLSRSGLHISSLRATHNGLVTQWRDGLRATLDRSRALDHERRTGRDRQARALTTCREVCRLTDINSTKLEKSYAPLLRNIV